MKDKTLQLMRFILVGGIATIIHYGIYLILSTEISHNLAYTVGYLISFVFNYFASIIFTFKVKSKSSNQVVKFMFAHVANYMLHIILLNVLVIMGVNSAIAPIFVYPIAIICNYFMVKKALIVK